MRAVRLDQAERVRRVVATWTDPVELVDVAAADVLLEHVPGRPAGDLADHLTVHFGHQHGQADRMPAVPDRHRNRVRRADPDGHCGVAEHRIVVQHKRLAELAVIGRSAAHHRHRGAGDLVDAVHQCLLLQRQAVGEQKHRRERETVRSGRLPGRPGQPHTGGSRIGAEIARPMRRRTDTDPRSSRAPPHRGPARSGPHRGSGRCWWRRPQGRRRSPTGSPRAARTGRTGPTGRP